MKEKLISYLLKRRFKPNKDKTIFRYVTACSVVITIRFNNDYDHMKITSGQADERKYNIYLGRTPKTKDQLNILMKLLMLNEIHYY